MKTIALAFRYLWSRPLSALLNLLLLTLGLASITFVLLVSEQVDRTFRRDLAGIDLVVGAKGSPLQMILAGVFQMDTPTGNVPLRDVQALRDQPQVAKVIPLSIGDSYKGFRIVGTTQDFLGQYRLKFAQGAAWSLPMQAVLGSEVALSSGLKVGDRFGGSHGLAGGREHTNISYRVSGVLAVCGCIADRLVLTATESVWQVHEKSEAVQEAPAADGAPPQRDQREVTMALVTYRNGNPQVAEMMPRWVNANTTMQAASPSLEVSRLLQLLGVGTEVLKGMGAVLLFTAALSVFIALWNAVRERRADLAMLRMLGATPGKVAWLLLCEALWLAVMASVLGLAAGHALTAGVGQLLEMQKSISVSGALWLPSEWWVPVAALVVATIAALIPAISAYRVDVAQLLNAR